MRTRLGLAVLLPLVLLACDQNGAAAQSPHPHVVLKAEPTPHDLPTIAPMLARVSQAVVNISVTGTVAVAQNGLYNDPFFRQFFGLHGNQAPEEHFQAVGSGVIIDAQHGYVVTNNHVVKNAKRVQVTLKDHRTFTAKIIGTDPQTDIAILQIPAQHLVAMPLGNSANLRVGDYVAAIGDPFGVGQTATYGIVSALGRTGLGIENYENFIQTDASINPGNSGGALVNMAGQLVGMNTAILSQSGGNVGVGFAIPVNMVRTIAQQLINHGKVTRGELGVLVQNLTPSLAQAMGLSVTEGAVVSEVLPGTPAQRAGLKAGDVIIKLNGEALPNSSELRNRVAELRPGTKVGLTYLRNGHPKTVEVTLALMKAGAGQGSATPATGFLSGITVGPIPQDSPDYGQVKGVYLQQVQEGSEAANAGLQPGDIITSVDHHPVPNIGALNMAVRNHPKGRPMLLTVRRGQAEFFVAVQ
ncbi:MAG: DegQ family serine endoprotease [Alphaproteobacteria bacterium]|nr:DegQ family serine endoprotease [Alphaproteobacteria bacterium]